MAAGESGLKSRILEIVRTTKPQREPLTAGSEYVDTKRVIQAYEEQRKYLKARLDEARGELATCKALPCQCQLVKEGFVVKRYGFLIPLKDDLDIVAELELAIRSLKESHGLGMYFDDPSHHGRIVLYKYPIAEMCLFMQEPLNFNMVSELEKMVRSFRAAYAVQVYSGAIRSVEEAIRWEENASMIIGNRELAERLKESDTTLLVGLAAGAQGDEGALKPEKLPAEPSMAEVERALQDLAAGDLEIKTPSSIATKSPLDADSKATGVDVVNAKSSKRAIRKKEKAQAKPKAKAAA